jgi:ribosome-associated protein
MRELSFKAVCGSGPGGQHVNKVATKVVLSFDVAHSPTLRPWQRERIAEKLAGRMDKDGVLKIASSSERSQRINKERAVERFVHLLRWALHRDAPRKATKVSANQKKKRLDSKRKRSDVKANRRSPKRYED